MSEINPAAVLLARLWSIEESDGGWNGADTVDVVCEWLTEQGLNITHPAERIIATGDKEDRETWEFDELLNVAQSQLAGPDLTEIDPATRDPYAYPEGFDAITDAHGN